MLKLTLRNLLRHPLRAALTVVGMALAILAFALLRTMVSRFGKRGLATYAAGLLRETDPGARLKAAVIPQPLPEPLSPQELRVLRLLAAGLSNQEIASELVVSINTIKTQVRSILRKLDVDNRDEARLVARELGLLQS